MKAKHRLFLSDKILRVIGPREVSPHDVAELLRKRDRRHPTEPPWTPESRALDTYLSLVMGTLPELMRVRPNMFKARNPHHFLRIVSNDSGKS
jgi:hypothetical protein